MEALDRLLENNRQWATRRQDQDPGFFGRLAAQQNPEYLWIGCADSRVPANEIVGLDPGELFVHRNVANVVVHSDVNCLSVLQYAVEVLGVRHIIVCGHYGCGGVDAAMRGRSFGLIDLWLRHIQDVYAAHQAELDAIEDLAARRDRLCELNVREQVTHVCETPILQRAWQQDREVHVHGVIYGLENGLLKDLGVSAGSRDAVPAAYRIRE